MARVCALKKTPWTMPCIMRWTRSMRLWMPMIVLEIKRFIS